AIAANIPTIITAIITSIKVKPWLPFRSPRIFITRISLLPIIRVVRLDSISLIPRQLHPAVAAQVGVAEVTFAQYLGADHYNKFSVLVHQQGRCGGRGGL